jgi:hypothetical protein
MCLGRNKEFETRVLTPFNSKYPFKHWHKFKGMLLGKQFEQQSNYDIHVQQTEYAQTIQGIKLSMERKKQRDENTNDDEKKQMRAVLGAINWLVTGPRLDLAAACSLVQQHVMSSVVSDLLDVNRLVPQVHDLSELTIQIKSIPTENVCFMAIFDAAWPNAPGLFSQAGCMIAAMDKRIMKNTWGEFSLLRWKSFKQDRRTPSTLGAELIALSRSLAEGRWMKSMWLEANYHDYTLGENTKWQSQVPMCAIVDNKPLYDHAKSINGNNIKDKRHAIEMLIVKEALRTPTIHVRRVATFQMLGDVLTKRGVSVDL